MVFFVGLYSFLRSRRHENLQMSELSVVCHEDRFIVMRGCCGSYDKQYRRVGCDIVQSGILLSTFLLPWRWTRQVPPPCWQRATKSHGVTSPKTSIWNMDNNLNVFIWPVYLNTGLFKMIVGVQLSSDISAPNAGNIHHLTIPFEGGMNSFKRQGACVSRNWRYESEPPLKPSPLTCGTNSIIVLMFVESQRVHIQSTCKVCNKNLECCSMK